MASPKKTSVSWARAVPATKPRGSAKRGAPTSASQPACPAARRTGPRRCGRKDVEEGDGRVPSRVLLGRWSCEIAGVTYRRSAGATRAEDVSAAHDRDQHVGVPARPVESEQDAPEANQ